MRVARSFLSPCAAAATCLAVAILLLAAAGCGDGNAAGGGDGSSDATAAAEKPRHGGTYNYPLQEDPGAFVPAMQAPGEGFAVLHEIYESLTRCEEQPDGSLQTVPCLAESWSANADATVWTFKLRRGVLFHPPVSREVTAGDVVADLRYIAEPANRADSAYMLAGIRGVDGEGRSTGGELGVEALDRYTVRFTLQRPFSEFADALTSGAFWVWPVDHMKKVGMEAYAWRPVGTGPYMVEKRTPGRSIDLARNPRWWDTSGGPYIDTVHYQVYGSVSSMMLAFQKGLVDWTWVPRGQVAASRSLPQVENGEWRAESSPLLALGYLCVNMDDPVVGGEQGLALRQALTRACDRQAAIDAASDGVYGLPSSLLPPGVPGAAGVEQPYPYDPAKAKELMDERGPVTLRLLCPIDRLARTVAETLAPRYAEIGITLNVKALEWSDFVARLAAGKSQLFLLGWVADYPSMDNFLYPLFESGSSGASLSTFYADPEVDDLLNEARATPQEEARAARYLEAERLVLADAPVVPVFVYADYRLISERVADVRFNSMAWVDLWRAWVR